MMDSFIIRIEQFLFCHNVFINFATYALKCIMSQHENAKEIEGYNS